MHTSSVLKFVPQSLLLFFLVIVFIAKPTFADSACAHIEKVEYVNASQGTNGVHYTCKVTVSPQFAGSEYIACGMNINGIGYYNPCPSDTNFLGWNGNVGSYDCNDNFQAGDRKLTAYDFRHQCGPDTGINLPVSFSNQQLPTTAPTTVIPPDPSGNNPPGNNPPNTSGSVVNDPNIIFSPINQNGSASIGQVIIPNTPVNGTQPKVGPSNSSKEKKGVLYLNSCNPAITSRTSVVNSPSITVQGMKNIMRSYNSPAYNEAESIYNLGVQYGIDPMILLVFFAKESTMGKNGSSNPNKNIGNIECGGSSCGVGGRFKKYSTWTDGARDWYRLIKEVYVEDWQLYYLETILPTYAPSFENDTCLYINQIKSWYDTKFDGRDK